MRRMMTSAGSLPKLPAVAQLSSRIIRILGANPSPFTLQGTNSYLVGQKKNRWLIDTSNPNKTEYLENLRKTLVENDAVVSNILITHWHEDHIGAVPEVQNLCQELSGLTPKMHKFPSGPDPEWAKETDFEVTALTDDQKIEVDEGTTLRVLFTPGHTEDHVAVMLEEERVLFAGDIILGHGSAVFESLSKYMASLERLRKLSPPWSRILSAHGAEIEDGDGIIATYISHRQQRISQVAACLNFSDWMTPSQILDKVYPGLAEALQMGAINNILQALHYLKDVGRAEENGENGWRALEGSKL